MVQRNEFPVSAGASMETPVSGNAAPRVTGTPMPEGAVTAKSGAMPREIKIGMAGEFQLPAKNQVGNIAGHLIGKPFVVRAPAGVGP